MREKFDMHQHDSKPKKYHPDHQKWMQEDQMPKCKRYRIDECPVCGNPGHVTKWEKIPVVFGEDNKAEFYLVVQHGHFTSTWDGVGRNVNCKIALKRLEKMYWQIKWQIIGNKNWPEWLRKAVSGGEL